MEANGVWFGNDRWPSGASPGAWARDVFRIEGCSTDRDKAMALSKWFLRCMNRGGGARLKTPNMGGMLRSVDPLDIFCSWGHNDCSGWGWVPVEAMQAAGLKARRVVITNSTHTIYEVWYAARDGKEGWHAFDGEIGWYFLNDAGEVASCAELVANPDLIRHPRPGGRGRLGHHPERSLVAHYAHHLADQLDIEQPLDGRQICYHPRIGQSYHNLWRPEAPALAWKFDKYPAGLHCDISLYDESGQPRYPEHLPYWKHYVWPADAEGDFISGTEPVRWHGSGTLRWQPLRYGAQAAWRAEHAAFDDGWLRPAGTRKHCEVWWHIQLPYLATYLRINAEVEASGTDRVGFALSPDGGRSVHGLYGGVGPPPPLLTFASPMPGAATCPGVVGLREFYLRLDMSTQSSVSRLCVRHLNIAVGYHLNMHLLPRLLPGDNELYLSADQMNGVDLGVEWAYTHPQGERLESLILSGAGVARSRLNPGIDRPDEIIMRGVTLRCEPEA